MSTATAPAKRLPNWVTGMLPLLLIALLVVLFIALDPIGKLREVPPAEALAVERTIVHENSIELHVRNDGPDPVTIAQVLVDDAYRPFEISDATLGRLRTATIEIPYRWEEGLPLNIALLTSTGLTIEHEIEALALTPEVDPATLLTYGLLGLYIGVIPVAVGLLWFPSLRRASPAWLAFFLAFTVGLLAFLLIDTVAEGLDLAGASAASLDGLGLFGIGALGAFAALTALGHGIGRSGRDLAGLPLAYFIAAGIGLHNMGEGLAVGAALAAGEVALGTFLVLGFMLHNTTEGLAIVSPLGAERTRPRLTHFVALGAIAQVIWAVAKTLPGEHRLGAPVGAAGLVAGLVVMYATGLFTA